MRFLRFLYAKKGKGENVEYKKSYQGIIWWIVLFFLLLAALVFLPFEDGDLLLRITLNVSGFLIVLLFLMIYLTEAVYWINGVEYEQAKEAGKERRKRFAVRHLKRVGYFALLYLLYSVAAQLAGFGIGLDVALWTVGMIIAAVSTIPIKL